MRALGLAVADLTGLAVASFVVLQERLSLLPYLSLDEEHSRFALYQTGSLRPVLVE